MTRRLVCVALAAALGSVHSACDEPCGPSETRANVRYGRGGYVCIPKPSDDDSPPPAPPSTSSSPAPAPVPMPAPPPPACSSQEAGKLDVHVVARDGAPDVLQSSSPPPGSYTVVQVTAFGSSAISLPIDVMRAEVKVTGARLELGAQVVYGGIPERLESFVLTTATGLLVKVCESRIGRVSSALLPGEDGSTRASRLSWDASRGSLALVLTSSYGEVELVLAPKT